MTARLLTSLESNEATVPKIEFDLGDDWLPGICRRRRQLWDRYPIPMAETFVTSVGAPLEQPESPRAPIVICVWPN